MNREEYNEWYSAYEYWFSVKRPTDLLASTVKLGEEVGEVCEAVAAINGSLSKEKKLLKKGQTPRDALLEELGDVMVVIHNIATLANIPHREIFAASATKALRRAHKIREQENVKIKVQVRSRKGS